MQLITKPLINQLLALIRSSQVREADLLLEHGLFSQSENIATYWAITVIIQVTAFRPGTRSGESHLIFEVGEQVILPLLRGDTAVGKQLNVGLYEAHEHLCGKTRTGHDLLAPWPGDPSQTGVTWTTKEFFQVIQQSEAFLVRHCGEGVVGVHLLQIGHQVCQWVVGSECVHLRDKRLG